MHDAPSFFNDAVCRMQQSQRRLQRSQQATAAARRGAEPVAESAPASLQLHEAKSRRCIADGAGGSASRRTALTAKALLPTADKPAPDAPARDAYKHSACRQRPAAVRPTKDAPMPGNRPGEKLLVITFRRTGDVERDKFRLREIYEMVRDPRGRDRFAISIVDGVQTARLAFPNDLCSINERLINDLEKHLRLKVNIENGPS